MNYKDSYMNFIMTPPERNKSDYDQYAPNVSTMKWLSKDNGDNSLGQAQVSESGLWMGMTPIMIGVSVFVISAFTAVTIYIIMSQMRRGR